MLKVRIIGPRTRLDEVIRTLHEAAVVHIEMFPSERMMLESAFLSKLPIESGKLKEKEWLEKAAARVKNLMAFLPESLEARPERVQVDEIRRRMGELAHVEEKAVELRSRKDSLSEELSSVDKYERLLRGFAPVVSRLGGLKNFEIVGLTLDKTREEIAALLEGEVARITGSTYQMYVRPLDEHTLGVVMAFPRHFALQVRALLAGRSIGEVRLPDEYADMALIEALKLMGRRRAVIPALISEADSALAALSAQWRGAAAGVAGAIDDALDEIGALSYAVATRFAFIIEGWVPADKREELASRFSRLFGDSVRVETIDLSRQELESAPVYIHNPALIRPFEVFLSALAPPRYASIDPTPFIAIFFPAFFGLIVADMGYGALILAVSLYLRRRLRARGRFLWDLATVMAISSVAAIIFGFLFGELFGDLGERLDLVHPVLTSRIDALKTLMYVAVGIGAGHVVLGIALSFIIRLSRREVKEAGARLAYLVVVLSLLGVAAVVLGYLPRGFLIYGAVIMVVAFIAFTAIEGVLGPIEVMEAIGNIVSYVRIMAVGTASVVMALVANRVGGLAESVAAGIAAATLLHALNLLLSVLSPSIQSMRLQYVEFLTKFYEGGGRKYRPFRKR